MCQVYGQLNKLPDFPFSGRYAPCSNECVYHWLAKAYNIDFLEEAKKELPLSGQLLCLEGYRQYGFAGTSCYVEIKHCQHCGD